MSTQPKQHNESRAEFNSDGPTVDTEVSVSKDSLKQLGDRLEIASLVIGIAASAVTLWRKRQS